MANGFERVEYPQGHTATGSMRSVDARLHHLSRRAELRYLTVQVCRVAQAELDAYRKAKCALAKARPDTHGKSEGELANAELDDYRKAEGTYNA